MNSNTERFTPPPPADGPKASTKAAHRFLPLIAAGLFVFGGIFMAVGVVMYVKARRLVNEGVTASGVVTAMEARRSSSSNNKGSSSSLTYYPRFRFADASGQTREITSNFGTNPPSYAVGDAISVRYLPADPDSAVIDSWSSLWLFPIVFIGVAVLPEIAGAILLIVWVRKRRTAAMSSAANAGELPPHRSLQDRLQHDRG